MPQSTTRESRKNRLLLLALWLLFYASFTLLSPPLLDDADSVHAEVAREMILRHDFVTLYANGIRYLEKAPLYYWLMAASMRLYGPTTAASRAPLSYTILALTFLLEAFARRAFNPRTGLYAGLITLSSFGIFIFSRINIPDLLVCLFLTAALYLYYLSDRVPHPHDGLTVVRVGLERSSTAPAQSQLTPTPTPTLLLSTLFAASLALSVLTKGLIGIVFPLTIVLAHLLLTRGPRETLARLRRLHPALSALTFLAIAAPWHILIALANPAHGHPLGLTHAGGHWHLPYPTDGNVHSWAWFYFLNEQLYRYLNLRIPHDYDTSPLWLFLGLIFIWLMPWSAYLPPALLRACHSLTQPSTGHKGHSERSRGTPELALRPLATRLRGLTTNLRTPPPPRQPEPPPPPLDRPPPALLHLLHPPGVLRPPRPPPHDPSSCELSSKPRLD